MQKRVLRRAGGTAVSKSPEKIEEKHYTTPLSIHWSIDWLIDWLADDWLVDWLMLEKSTSTFVIFIWLAVGSCARKKQNIPFWCDIIEKLTLMPVPREEVTVSVDVWNCARIVTPLLLNDVSVAFSPCGFFLPTLNFTFWKSFFSLVFFLLRLAIFEANENTNNQKGEYRREKDKFEFYCFLLAGRSDRFSLPLNQRKIVHGT